MQEGQRERKRERIPGRLCTVSTWSVWSPIKGWNSHTGKSWPELKSEVGDLTDWSHRHATVVIFFFFFDSEIFYIYPLSRFMRKTGIITLLWKKKIRYNFRTLRKLIGVPEWHQLSIRLQLSSWYCGSWVWAPHQALCCGCLQRPLWILCPPFSLPFPHSISLSQK